MIGPVAVRANTRVESTPQPSTAQGIDTYEQTPAKNRIVELREPQAKSLSKDNTLRKEIQKLEDVKAGYKKLKKSWKFLFPFLESRNAQRAKLLTNYGITDFEWNNQGKGHTEALNSKIQELSDGLNPGPIQLTTPEPESKQAQSVAPLENESIKNDWLKLLERCDVSNELEPLPEAADLKSEIDGRMQRIGEKKQEMSKLSAELFGDKKPLHRAWNQDDLQKEINANKRLDDAQAELQVVKEFLTEQVKKVENINIHDVNAVVQIEKHIDSFQRTNNQENELLEQCLHILTERLKSKKQKAAAVQAEKNEINQNSQSAIKELEKIDGYHEIMSDDEIKKIVDAYRKNIESLMLKNSEITEEERRGVSPENLRNQVEKELVSAQKRFDEQQARVQANRISLKEDHGSLDVKNRREHYIKILSKTIGEMNKNANESGIDELLQLLGASPLNPNDNNYNFENKNYSNMGSEPDDLAMQQTMVHMGVLPSDIHGRYWLDEKQKLGLCAFLKARAEKLAAEPAGVRGSATLNEVMDAWEQLEPKEVARYRVDAILRDENLIQNTDLNIFEELVKKMKPDEDKDKLLGKYAEIKLRSLPTPKGNETQEDNELNTLRKRLDELRPYTEPLNQSKPKASIQVTVQSPEATTQVSGLVVRETKPKEAPKLTVEPKPIDSLQVLIEEGRELDKILQEKSSQSFERDSSFLSEEKKLKEKISNYGELAKNLNLTDSKYAEEKRTLLMQTGGGSSSDSRLRELALQNQNRLKKGLIEFYDAQEEEGTKPTESPESTNMQQGKVYQEQLLVNVDIAERKLKEEEDKLSQLKTQYEASKKQKEEALQKANTDRPALKDLVARHTREQAPQQVQKLFEQIIGIKPGFIDKNLPWVGAHLSLDTSSFGNVTDLIHASGLTVEESPDPWIQKFYEALKKPYKDSVALVDAQKAAREMLRQIEVMKERHKDELEKASESRVASEKANVNETRANRDLDEQNKNVERARKELETASQMSKNENKIDPTLNVDVLRYRRY